LRILFEEGEQEDDDDEDEEDEEGYDGLDMERFRGPSSKRSPEEIANHIDKQDQGQVVIEAEVKTATSNSFIKG
jgi:hypothetical protein